MRGFEFPTDSNVIIGLDHADDAGVYKITDDIAMIQSVDFFTPVVDDPFSFGQIAAANALSDIYAMGGVPKTAMNLVAFPAKNEDGSVLRKVLDRGMDMSVLRSILEGGMDKMKEAGVVLMGGHSIADKELKYGLSVTGFIHPDKVLSKKTIKPGDSLVLTKPIGTGIINTAMKKGVVPDNTVESVTAVMATLNKTVAEVMADHPVLACTDITGFGLLGHLAEMVTGSDTGIEIFAEKVPVFEGTREYAEKGLVPGGTKKTRAFREKDVIFSPSIDPIMQDILFDPQTSGGLLICVENNMDHRLVDELRQKGVESATVIGKTVSEPKNKIVVI